MITENRGELMCECKCGTRAYGGTAEFIQFVADLREDGWDVRKVKEKWVHTCPECASS